MKRFGAIAWLSGAVLVSTHLLAPAETRVTSTVALTDQRTSPAVVQLNAQVDRLQHRLANPPAYPPPARDPFRFGSRPEPSRPKPPAPAATPTVERAAPVQITLPHLIAIATNVIDGTLVRSAVVAAGDDVQVVEAGAKLGAFDVRAIGIDGVEVTDAAGRVYRISLQ